MKRYKQILHTLIALSSLTALLLSCDPRMGETVESAYTETVWEKPIYRFKRNGRSSVQTHEVEQLARAVERIHYSYLLRPDFQFAYRYTDMMQIYKEGLQSSSPMEMLSASPTHKNNRSAVRADIQSILDAVAIGAGYNISGSMVLKQQPATQGKQGYVGLSVGDDNVFYVNEQGLNFATLYNIYMVAAIYLDQILNEHLRPELYDDINARAAHERVELLPGGNYTALEHHWDLAYGYYQHCRFITSARGSLVLRDADRKIHDAFVQGRIALEIGDYTDLHKQRVTIQTELSKAVAIQATLRLLGANTIANINDEVQYAFTPLTEGYALLYALHFTRNEKGEAYYSYEEVKDLQKKLLQEKGFWDKERLLADAETTGSLKWIAKEIKKHYKIGLK